MKNSNLNSSVPQRNFKNTTNNNEPAKTSNSNKNFNEALKTFSSTTNTNRNLNEPVKTPTIPTRNINESTKPSSTTNTNRNFNEPTKTPTNINESTKSSSPTMNANKNLNEPAKTPTIPNRNINESTKPSSSTTNTNRNFNELTKTPTNINESTKPSSPTMNANKNLNEPVKTPTIPNRNINESTKPSPSTTNTNRNFNELTKTPTNINESTKPSSPTMNANKNLNESVKTPTIPNRNFNEPTKTSSVTSNPNRTSNESIKTVSPTTNAKTHNFPPSKPSPLSPSSSSISSSSSEKETIQSERKIGFNFSKKNLTDLPEFAASDPSSSSSNSNTSFPLQNSKVPSSPQPDPKRNPRALTKVSSDSSLEISGFLKAKPSKEASHTLRKSPPLLSSQRGTDSLSPDSTEISKSPSVKFKNFFTSLASSSNSNSDEAKPKKGFFTSKFAKDKKTGTFDDSPSLKTEPPKEEKPSSHQTYTEGTSSNKDISNKSFLRSNSVPHLLEGNQSFLPHSYDANSISGLHGEEKIKNYFSLRNYSSSNNEKGSNLYLRNTLTEVEIRNYKESQKRKYELQQIENERIRLNKEIKSETAAMMENPSISNPEALSEKKKKNNQLLKEQISLLQRTVETNKKKNRELKAEIEKLWELTAILQEEKQTLLRLYNQSNSQSVNVTLENFD